MLDVSVVLMFDAGVFGLDGDASLSLEKQMPFII